MIEPIFSSPEVHKKSWGQELWIHNSDKYCGKILEINKDCYFSMHYHLKKEETWMVLSGELEMEFYNLKDATKQLKIIKETDVVHIVPGLPHKLRAISESRIMEVSTQHFEEDSYRIEKSI